MSNQYKEKPRRLLAGVKVEARQKLNGLTAELKSVWQHRNVGRIWYLLVHCIGVVGYVVFSLCSAITFLIVFVMVSFAVDDVKKSGAMKSTTGMPKFLNLFWLVGWLLQALFLAVYAIFAGFMGWGSQYSKPSHIPGHIIGSIPSHVLPNRTTQFFGYLTIVAVTAYIIQLFYLVYGGV